MCRLIKYILLFSCLLWSSTLFSQDLLTLSKALEIAVHNSPDLKQYALSLERSQESLKSQEAALKSDFDLSFKLDPPELFQSTEV